MADTLTLGRTTQIGPEAVAGTPVAATKQLTDLTISLDPAFGVTNVRGTGQRADAVVAPDGQERVTGKVGGALGYNSFAYLCAMLWGNPQTGTPTTPSGGVNARQWLWVPPLTGALPPKTFTTEQGDANDAEQVSYCALTDLGVDFTRAANTPSGNLIGRALNKTAAAGGSFTGMAAGATAVPIVPILPVQWAVYMDDAGTSIGQTQLLRCFHAAFSYASSQLPFFPLNPSISSFAGLADNPAQSQTCLLELMKDAVGESLWNKARAGQKKYIRLKATSTITTGGVTSGWYADNYFTVTITGATAGTFTITYKGQATAGISWNATAAQVLTAFTALSTVGAGNATASGGPLPGTPVVITMAGALANDPALPTANFTGLTAGTNSLVQSLIPYSLQIDMCASIRQPGPMADNSGLRTRQWDFNLTGDPTWVVGSVTGVFMAITLVNTLTGY